MNLSVIYFALISLSWRGFSDIIPIEPNWDLSPTLGEMIPCPKNDCYLSKSASVICKGVPKEDSSTLSCLTDLEGTVEIGKKQGCRGIQKDSLDNLIPIVAASRKNIGTITFSLNILQILENNFDQLEDFNLNLNFLNILKLSPDAFINLKRIQSIRFQRKLAPKEALIFEHDSERLDMNLGELERKKINSFIRLKPEDMDSLITFNIPVCCHRCQNTNMIIVSFLCGESVGDSGLYFVFPDQCLVKYNALGCPLPKEVTNESIYVPTKRLEAVLNKTSNEVIAFEESVKREKINEIQLTIILLSVWCFLITLALIIFICMFCQCRRKKSTSPNKLLNFFYPNNLYPNSGLLTVESHTPSTTLATNSNTISNNSNKGPFYDLQYNQLDNNSTSDCDDSLNLTQTAVVPKKRNFTFLNGSMKTSNGSYNEHINHVSDSLYHLPKERKSKKKIDGVYVNLQKYNTIRISSENINGINCIEMP